ncbi:hypothetical protein HGB13_00675 [bacterium]|nr:hypothetical protein [bacterium]
MNEKLTPDPMDQGVPVQPEMPAAPTPEAPAPEAPAPEPVQPPAPAPEVPVAPVQPVAPAPVQDYAQPTQQQYYGAPQAQMYGSDSGDSFNGYFDGLKSLISTPQRLINGLSQDITKAFIFIGISLGLWAGTNLITEILRTLKMNGSAQKAAEEYADKWGTELEMVTKVEINGDWFGNWFKHIGLTSLYAVGFICLIAGVVYVLSLIAKKNSDFIKSFGLTSVLSINFVSAALVSVVALISLYLTDMADFVGLITASISGIAFIYSSVLLIKGVVENVDLSYFVVVCAYVISVVFGLFILGKMIKDYELYFSVDFGRFGSTQSALLETLDRSLADTIENFDIDDYLK